MVSPTPPSPHRCVLPIRRGRVLLGGGRGQRATRSAAERFLPALLASVALLRYENHGQSSPLKRDVRSLGRRR